MKVRKHRPVRQGARGFAVAFAAMKKARIDAVLAERGLFPVALGRRRARCGPAKSGSASDGPVALRPSQLVEPEAELIVDSGPALRLARRDQARERARGARDRRSTGATASTSAPRPAASPTACCSAAPRGSPRSTSPTARSTSRLREDPRVTVIERLNARALGPADLLVRRRAGDGRRLLHLADQDPARGRRLPGARRRSAGDGQAAVRARPRAGRRAASSATPATAARRSCWSPTPPASSASPVRGFASSGLPGPKGNRETFVWCGRRGRRRSARPRGRRDRGRGAEARREAMKTAALITHSHPPAATEAVAVAAAVAARGGLAPGRRPRRSSTSTAPPPTGIEVASEADERRTSAWCSAATARSCTRCVASPAPSVPVFGVNFGTVGFLAAVERADAADGHPPRPRRRDRDDRAARPRGRGRRRRAASASTTSPCRGARTTGSPS